MVEQTETPSRDPINVGGEATPVARQLQFDFTVGKKTTVSERKRDYGKRKRGSDQAINYEVDSDIIINSSTRDTGRSKVHEDSSELEEREEIVRSGVIESSTERGRGRHNGQEGVESGPTAEINKERRPRSDQETYRGGSSQ